MYHIPKNTLLNRHLIHKNFRSTEHIDQRGIRLFYCRFGQGYQNLHKILAPKEEIEIFSRNINNPDNRNFFFQRIRNFVNIFPDEEKIIEYQEQKKCQRFTPSIRKKFEITGRNEEKLIEENEKKVLSQTYILYDKAGMVKPTFVIELQQYVNIFSQFTTFCEESDKNLKNFTKNQKNDFQLKNSYTSKNEFSLTLRKLDGSPAKFISKEVSIQFLIKTHTKQKKKIYGKLSVVDTFMVLGIQDLT